MAWTSPKVGTIQGPRQVLSILDLDAQGLSVCLMFSDREHRAIFGTSYVGLLGLYLKTLKPQNPKA